MSLGLLYADDYTYGRIYHIIPYIKFTHSLKGNQRYLRENTMTVKPRKSHTTVMNLNKNEGLIGINNNSLKPMDV